MDDHDCSMCEFYSNLDGWCSRYREMHYPSDGEGCPGGILGQSEERRKPE